MPATSARYRPRSTARAETTARARRAAGAAAASPPVPARTSRRSRATIWASRAGSTRSMRRASRPRRSGCPASAKNTADPASAATGRRETAQLDTGKLRRIARDDAGRRGQHEPRKQQQHRDEVEQALEDDRRKRRRRVEALAARQQVRPDHFAGARRQQKPGGKADDRGPERGAEARRADRREQILPAQARAGVGHARHDDRAAAAATGWRAGFRPRRRRRSTLRRKTPSNPSVSRKMRAFRTRGCMRRVYGQSGLESGDCQGCAIRTRVPQG